MCRSEWEMEKKKKQGEQVVFDLWPFFSSLLPTFIPLGPLLLISHSLSATHVHQVLCFRLFAAQNVTTVLPLNMGIVGLSAVVK